MPKKIYWIGIFIVGTVVISGNTLQAPQGRSGLRPEPCTAGRQVLTHQCQNLSRAALSVSLLCYGEGNTCITATTTHTAGGKVSTESR